MASTSIEWTNDVWNPVTGCTEVSPGCDHCYAKRFAERWRGTENHPYEQGFDLKLWEERLLLPLSWKKPRRIFVNSMSDLFHKDVPSDFIIRAFDTMARANWHTFQVLTKRPGRLALLAEDIARQFEFINYAPRWPAHIWMGVSIESQDYAWRLSYLRRIPAPVRFISAEPLLGPLKLNLDGVQWLITGAESGPGARPMELDWVRSLRDQAQAAGTRFFLKQYVERGKKVSLPELDGRVWAEFPEVDY
jgi:protein gp37